MKKKTKNKILLTTMFSCLGLMLGLACFNNYSEVKQVNAESLKYEHVKKADYDEGSSIHLTKEEIEETNFNNLNSYLVTNYEDLSTICNTFELEIFSPEAPEDSFECGLNEVIYQQTYASFDYEDSYDGYNVRFNYPTFNNNKIEVYKYNSVTHDYTLYTNYTEIGFNFVEDTYYNELETAFKADLAPTMSESIIDAVTSGLGLIGDLASEFLTGFSTLFWDATNSQLTDFGLFSMIFLGIAITMAVIKLVLAILRSNTGV